MVKLFIPILLIIFGLLSDYYIFHRYINTPSVWRWIWWFPAIVICGFILYFIFFGKGVGQEYNSVNVFLLLLGLFCLPKMLFTLFSFIPKIGEWIGLIAAVGVVWMILWGITYGFSQIKVREVVYESASVPKAFDGYRIVQFSDAHTGTFRGFYHHLLKESIDTINALNPDLICFVGDIENFSPSELEPHAKTFATLRAKDGVMSIMGNHDYSAYVRLSAKERVAMVRKTRQLQRSFGWRLLENEHHVIHRYVKDCDGQVHTDSIIVIGEENWGKPPFPQYGNLTMALSGLSLHEGKIRDAAADTPVFSIMLSHDPTAWKAHILPAFRPDITLSGHTHGTQFSLFEWSPASMVYDEWGGEYYDADVTGGHTLQQRHLLSVTTGFGGNFPFRFNMPREVVLLILKHKKTN